MGTTPARWDRIEELFLAAAELAPAERAAYLDRVAGGDTELRAEVESLLAAHEGGAGVLDAPLPLDDETQRAGRLESGARLGAWRVDRLVGEGGSGEVYAAERADGAFDQRAALKLLRRDAVGQ